MRLASFLPAALSLALAGCASAALPQEGKKEEWFSGTPTGRPDLDRVGPYMTLSVINSFEDFDASPGVETGDADPGIGIKGGLRVEPNVAVELALESVSGYEIDVGPAELDLDFLNVCLQGKFYFAQGRAQPFAFAGFGYTDAEIDGSTPFIGGFSESDSGAFFRVGAGVDVYVTPAVAVYGEFSYNRMFGDLKDLDHFDLGLGVLFRF